MLKSFVHFEIILLLHLTVTTERPVQVNVVKVKKSDKGDFYKRQTAWALRDLAVVDAKDAVKVCVTFFGLVLHSDHPFGSKLELTSLVLGTLKLRLITHELGIRMIQPRFYVMILFV